jgi:hypothetical protein
MALIDTEGAVGAIVRDCQPLSAAGAPQHIDTHRASRRGRIIITIITIIVMAL